jgi:hypothetical protein
LIGKEVYLPPGVINVLCNNILVGNTLEKMNIKITTISLAVKKCTLIRMALSASQRWWHYAELTE